MTLDFIASKIRMKKIPVHKGVSEWSERLYLFSVINMPEAFKPDYNDENP